MSNLLFYIIFILISFSVLLIALRLFPKDALFSIAIGSVIGSNIYNPVSYPVKIFGLVFGIDSIVYTIFIFCLLMMYMEYGKKDFKVLLYTSMFSILFTAFLYFMGTFSKNGYSLDLLLETLSYVYSTLGTFVSAILMVKVLDFLKSKNINNYISIFTVLVLASLINSFIYFILTFVTNKSIVDDLLISISGSYIGKLVSSIISIFIYFIYIKFIKKKPIEINNSK